MVEPTNHHRPGLAKLPVDLDITTTVTAIAALLAVWLAYRLLRIDAEKAVTFTVPAPEQTQAGWRGKTLDRPDIKVPGVTSIQCYAPATGQLLALVNPVTPAGIDRAVEKATHAQIEWARTTFAQRRRVLKTLLKFVLDQQETIARVACLDSGKTRVDAIFGELLVTAEKLKWTINHGEAALNAERRPTNFLMFYKRNEVHYEPLGVVAACVSWNYPFHNLIGPIISALFSGNAIVVKGSEQTAWSSAYFISIVRGALTACGHNADLVHSISCWPSTADHFTSHPGIAHMTFIGSRPIAHAVAKSAAKTLTPLCVELGGKDAAIILDNPTGVPEEPEAMTRIASILMRGVFQSAGQNCIGIERVVAMPQAYNRLRNLLQERIQKLRVGSDLNMDHVDMGAMISPASFDRLEKIIAEAVSQGARLIAGGHRIEHAQYPHGHYFEPTLLVDVTPEMRIAQEELFAPVCVMMRVDSVDDAIRVTNSTPYGLGCSVFGPNFSSASRAQLRRVANEVKSGMVAINDFAVFYAVQLPFGGVRGSGYGRFAAEEGLRSLCNVKSVCVDRWPWLIGTSIPSKLDYPMQSGAFRMGQGVVEMGYADSWMRMLGGVKKMI
ncbi:Aldehyde/histidinol dehydrogenase [Neohortaea acidophila]|uniref:aldehyde dehydrogenase (NAD(+)) n=1 Tax=Neohortaea acidophila TaxID=245834 RepID=A0A6A6PHT6_9PEZI|nr:Aldehyde/histidinol dehydrogenase [Neohortaea acidophila]KAF2479570.1 Aldehyde/histidinol dehydrogenase [Neohortaea acidophila]